MTAQPTSQARDAASRPPTGVAALARFMRMRHTIHIDRAAGAQPPWTDDAILQRFKFTNVYREFDRQTIWIDNNVRRAFSDHPHLWFMICIARIGYTRETLAQLIDSAAWPSRDGQWSHDALMKITLRNLRRLGGSGAFYAAYMVNHNLWHGLDVLWRARARVEPMLHGTLRQAFDALHEFPGWGPFMRYEVVTDLRHTRYLRDAPDIMTWVNMGPGSKRGLNRVAGRKLTAPWRHDDFCAATACVMEMVRREWPASWPALELRDIEHSLCEFDKYERARLGEGRPKQCFIPSNEFYGVRS